MNLAVDFGAPRTRRDVGSCQIGPFGLEQRWDQQVRLRVAAQVFDDALPVRRQLPAVAVIRNDFV
jgi:hypothetical protein